MYYASSLTCVWAEIALSRALFRLARPRGAPMLFGRCVLVYSCSLGNTAQTEETRARSGEGEIAGKAVVARILKTIKHRLKHRPALVAGVIVGAVAVLAIGACAMAAIAVRPEGIPSPWPTKVVAARSPEATAQTGQAAASQSTIQGCRRPARRRRRCAHSAQRRIGHRRREPVQFGDRHRAHPCPPTRSLRCGRPIAAYHDAGYEVGFVIYDLTTHARGVWDYNADQWFFSASTVKAPFVAFASQDMVDGGRASLDEEVVEDVILLDGTGIMSSDDIDRYDLQTVMANTIVHSDNTGYGLLRERFDQNDFQAWCAAADVDAAAWQGRWYPYYAARLSRRCG